MHDTCTWGMAHEKSCEHHGNWSVFWGPFPVLDHCMLQLNSQHHHVLSFGDHHSTGIAGHFDRNPASQLERRCSFRCFNLSFCPLLLTNQKTTFRRWHDFHILAQSLSMLGAIRRGSVAPSRKRLAWNGEQWAEHAKLDSVKLSNWTPQNSAALISQCACMFVRWEQLFGDFYLR